MKKRYVEPAVEVVSFLSTDALMSYYDGGNVGDVTPNESGAGMGNNWGDF